MFFKEYFLSIADRLDAQFRGMQRPGQNPTDKGELCEIFIRDLLFDLFADHFKIYRGGKIVDVDNHESKQMDIVLTAKNCLRIFGDKGIYPVESVWGVFSITATLDHQKLLDVIKEFNSIPKDNPRFIYRNAIEGIPGLEEQQLNNWINKIPFKCVFGFCGDINSNWENELNQIVARDSCAKNKLPDLIIVNKKGVITKFSRPTMSTKGKIMDKDFHYTQFINYKNYGAPFIYMVSTLFALSDWQYAMVPKYDDYFNKDLI